MSTKIIETPIQNEEIQCEIRIECKREIGKKKSFYEVLADSLQSTINKRWTIRYTKTAA